MQSSEIQRVVEAALLCAQQPLSVADLGGMFGPGVAQQAIEDCLLDLQQAWQDRGLQLLRVGSGWRFQSRPDLKPYLGGLHPEKPPKYSRAVLETLAIIAWRQPVSRGDIEDIRGVAVATQIIRTLEDRGWIEVVAYRDSAGRPALYGTTQSFLEDLGLRALDELPAIE